MEPRALRCFHDRAGGPAGIGVGALGRLVILVAFTLTFVTTAPAFAATADSQNLRLEEGISAYRAGAYGMAKDIFQHLSKKNDTRASYWLGRMYEEGVGVKKDAKRAVGYYRKAAQNGLRDAELRLGEIYFHGTEELQNFVEAHKWLERAAYDGVPVAQRELGKLYANGWGGPKDPVLAYVWFEIAAREGDYQAAQLRDGLLKTMPDAQIAKAQNVTREVASEVFGLAEIQAENTGHESRAPAKSKAPTHGKK
jgi:TPR repeat protein